MASADHISQSESSGLSSSDSLLPTMPKAKDDEVLRWREEAGLLDAPHQVFHDLTLTGTQLKDKARIFFSRALHEIRCKYAVSAVLILVTFIIVISSFSVFPKGQKGTLTQLSDEVVGPQLDPQMRPCRKVINFAQEPLPRIALASFMGSGNTWLRGAIEQVTGIWTGSSYPDNELYNGGFYGEMTNSDKVILVKTHAYGKKAARGNYAKTVLLIRKPEDAILAKWNQHKGRSHTGLASAESYDSSEWKYFAPKAIVEWRDTNEYWLTQNPSSVHVVKFEELMANKKTELRKILDFIGYKDVDEEMLECVAEKYEGVFKRRKYRLDFEPYNEDRKAELDAAKDTVQQALEEWKFSRSDLLELERSEFSQ